MTDLIARARKLVAEAVLPQSWQPSYRPLVQIRDLITELADALEEARAVADFCMDYAHDACRCHMCDGGVDDEGVFRHTAEPDDLCPVAAYERRRGGW